MATRADFTPEEWQSLERAPVFVAFATLAADMSGPVGLVKEMEALSQALEENALPAESDPAHDLIAAVAADLRATQSNGQGWGLILGEDGDPDSEQDKEHPSAVPGSGLDFSSPEKVKSQRSRPVARRRSCWRGRPRRKRPKRSGVGRSPWDAMWLRRRKRAASWVSAVNAVSEKERATLGRTRHCAGCLRVGCQTPLPSNNLPMTFAAERIRGRRRP